MANEQVNHLCESCQCKCKQTTTGHHVPALRGHSPAALAPRRKGPPDQGRRKGRRKVVGRLDRWRLGPSLKLRRLARKREE